MTDNDEARRDAVARAERERQEAQDAADLEAGRRRAEADALRRRLERDGVEGNS